MVPVHIRCMIDYDSYDYIVFFNEINVIVLRKQQETCTTRKSERKHVRHKRVRYNQPIAKPGQ
jgi:hypothetical protein